jgi:hypothetical protein
MGHWADHRLAVPPKIKKRDGGPVHGGEENPGTPESSPSTHQADYLGLAAQQPESAISPALMSLKRLVRGVY